MKNPFAGLFSAPALAPLSEPVYRGLWLAWVVANMTMWMNDVTAAWLMTQLTDSAVMVALVQTAATLPVFLLGLPSGAMADLIDRRRFFAATQLWVGVNAIVLALLSASGALNAHLLLVLTFVNGVGLALRLPVFASIVPDVVAREHFVAATALGAIAGNLSRVIGPAIAGALIANVGSEAVFALNAAMSAVGFWLILRWRSTPTRSTLPGERFVGAMRVGLQHVRESPTMRIVLLRIVLFFLQSSAFLALMPLVAQMLAHGGAATFTAMMGALGVGAIVAAFQFPRLRARYTRDQFVVGGTVLHAIVSTLVVTFPDAWVAIPASALIGAGWISVTNSLSLSAQMLLPRWVRARGLSIFQMAMMGGTAVGAALWGQVAGMTSVTTAIVAAAFFGPILLFVTRRLSVQGDDVDLSPLPIHLPEDAAVDVQPDQGPVMVVVEYLIDPARADAFAAVMNETRAARMRQGALSWGLFRDATQPGRYIEYFVDETWVEHQRRLERFTAADEGLRERRYAFHLGDAPPRVERYVAAEHKS